MIVLTTLRSQDNNNAANAPPGVLMKTTRVSQYHIPLHSYLPFPRGEDIPNLMYKYCMLSLVNLCHGKNPLAGYRRQGTSFSSDNKSNLILLPSDFKNCRGLTFHSSQEQQVFCHNPPPCYTRWITVEA